MSVIDCGGDLSHHAPDQVEGQLRLAYQPCLQRLPVDQGHDEIEQQVRVVRVEERKDAGMMQVGEQPDLAQEARWAQERCPAPLEDLESDGAAVGRIPPSKNKGCAARADLLPTS